MSASLSVRQIVKEYYFDYVEVHVALVPGHTIVAQYGPFDIAREMNYIILLTNALHALQKDVNPIHPIRCHATADNEDVLCVDLMGAVGVTPTEKTNGRG